MPADRTLDLSPSNVHVPSPWPGFVSIARAAKEPLPAAKRNALPNSAFALPTQRKFPIHDAAHARNAMARLEQQKVRMTPADYKTAKNNILKAYKRFKITPGDKVTPTGRGTRASIRTAGLSIHVRHLRDSAAKESGELRLNAVEVDPALAYVADGDGEAPKAVWNQIAKLGQWQGHISGPFQITPRTVSEIIANFRATTNRKIPIDFEHASEMEANTGTIPSGGAPAQGWIIDLEDRGADGLWGLIEWGDLAREYITAKPPKYRFFSPAIRFNSRDRVTGINIGARLSSGALTNTPFLDGMAEMAASDKDTGTTTVIMGFAHSSDESMPLVRQCLGMDPLATARECMDRVCRLEELYGKAGKIEMTEGVDLGAFMPKMRDMISAPLGSSWEDVFDVVKALIRAAMGEHMIEEHNTDDEPISSRDMRATTMAEQSELTIKLNQAEARLSDTEKRLAAAEATVVTLKATEKTLSDENIVLKDSEKRLLSSITELKTKSDAQETELKTLREEANKRRVADENARVDAALLTYGDKRGLTADHKSVLLRHLQSDREGFEQLYPPVPENKQYLLRQLVTPGAGNMDPMGRAAGAPPPSGAPAAPKETMVQLSERFQREGMSLSDAVVRANAEFKAREQQARRS